MLVSYTEYTLTTQQYKDNNSTCALSGKNNLPANAGDSCLMPGLGRSPGVEIDNPLQYSCLESSMAQHGHSGYFQFGACY